jgi:Rod binding domain-containing protein
MGSDLMIGLPPVSDMARRDVPGPKAAIEDFEAYLIGEMLRRATKSEMGNSLLSGGEAGRMYQELFYEEIGRVAARSGGFGLGDALADSLDEKTETGRPGGDP